MKKYNIMETLLQGKKLDLCICKEKDDNQVYGIYDKEARNLVAVGEKEYICKMFDTIEKPDIKSIMKI
ncbi:MAG: hypothetical protein Q4G60_14695 [bacterium]|nr:hypothetical protein [bacterium]